MKKILLLACLLLPLTFNEISAQVSTSEMPVATGGGDVALQEAPARPKYGTLRYDSLLHALPEYTAMEEQLTALRQQYEAEAVYNETAFKRMFAEFLQGQKDFPENILLKRQRELQNALERGIAFRQEAEKLLDNARTDMERPIRQLLDRAIAATAELRGYEVVVNLDGNALPFVSPTLTENATPFVIEMIGTLRNY